MEISEEITNKISEYFDELVNFSWSRNSHFDGRVYKEEMLETTDEAKKSLFESLLAGPSGRYTFPYLQNRKIQSKWYRDQFRVDKFWLRVIGLVNESTESFDSFLLMMREVGNFNPRPGSMKYFEANLLLIACVTERWEIFELMLHSESNVDSCFTEGSYRSRNVLMWLVQKNQVDLFHRALNECNGDLYSRFHRKSQVDSTFDYIARLMKWEFLPSNFTANLNRSGKRESVKWVLFKEFSSDKKLGLLPTLQSHHIEVLTDYFYYDEFRVSRERKCRAEDLFELILSRLPEFFVHLVNKPVSKRLKLYSLFQQVMTLSGSFAYPVFKEKYEQYCSTLAQYPFPVDLYHEVLSHSDLFHPNVPFRLISAYFDKFLPVVDRDPYREWEVKTKKVVALNVYQYHLNKSVSRALESGDPFHVFMNGSSYNYTILNMIFQELDTLKGAFDRQTRLDIEMLLRSLPQLNRQNIRQALNDLR